MKWTYTIQHKMAAAGALFTLCLLVLFSNYTDRKHTNDVKQSISTLYEDRLVVEDYILKMTIDIYEIRQALHNTQHNNEPATDQLTARLSHIDELSEAYKKTKFTETEDSTFAQLMKTVNELESSSSQNIQSKLTLANQALALLNELSSIQLEESKSIMTRAESLYKSGKSASQFAFAVTIIILLVLQGLVFTSKTISDTAQPSSPRLN